MGVKRAIVIGVDEYSDERIRPLPGARYDAREMHDLLDQDPDFQLDPLLLGKEATGDAVRMAISELLWRTDPLDLALFYFSGHAFDDTYGNAFLAPFDMDYERPLVHGIRMQELNDLMRKAVNKAVVLVMLDSCKSGIAASGDKGPPPTETSVEHAFDLHKGIHDSDAKGRVVLASSGPDEKSIELSDCRHQFLGGAPHPHGAFTYYVLEGLSGAAASDSADVTLSALHAYVERALKGTQHVTFFGGGLQDAQNIRLLKATNFAKINGKITEAERLLAVYHEAGSPGELFWAVDALVRVRRETENNEKAVSLRKEVDDLLRAKRDNAIWYVASNKLDLGPNCSKTCQRLENLLPDISVDVLADAKDMLGLLMTLWQAIDRPEDSPAHKVWRSQMSAFEKHAQEPPQLLSRPPLGSPA